MNKQVFNPYLPLDEYIPDGEPHIFNGRVYIYGSHDKEGGYTFCMRDYVTYSADINDLKNWRYEGVIYKASQDPQYPNLKYMYAPDVCQGNDGRYYLVYAMGGDYGYGGYVGPISIAVADSPVGPFEFVDFVKYPDGRPMTDYVPFDPAILNDNGTIRLYFGTQYGFEEEEDFLTNPKYLKDMMGMFGKSKEEILYYMEHKGSCMGPMMVVLEDDMCTIKEEPVHIIPCHVKGTTFEAHPFFEGPSMRKVGNKYYFVYSSWLNHELCYATSDYPDRDFVYGGTIVSNGDVGYNGRLVQDKLNMTGTTHGSIINIKDNWYVFFHRLTHKSDYSRQSCAEKIEIAADGSIKQVEVTSCGLNGSPLEGFGTYLAPIACNLTNGNMPHGSNSIYKYEFPNVSHKDNERFIAEIEHGTLIGYKYFDIKDLKTISVVVRNDKQNKVVYDGPVRLDERCFNQNKNAKTYLDTEPSCESFIEVRLSPRGEAVGFININPTKDWTTFTGNVAIPNGIHPLYFVYSGKEKIQLLEFTLN